MAKLIASIKSLLRINTKSVSPMTQVEAENMLRQVAHGYIRLRE